MNTIRQIQELNKRELESAVSTEGSWHADYRDTAYIYIGGLPFDFTEGDVITVFSQFGEPVYINMVRDKETGKSKGFAFLKYEDQRSTDLAVDNLGGATVLGRVLRVDHTRYKRKEGEEEVDNTGWNPKGQGNGDVTEDEEDGGRRKKRRTESESEEERPLLKEEIELAKLVREHDDDDPMKAYMVKQKREEVEEALKKYMKSRNKESKHKHHSKRHRRDRSRDRERSDRRIKAESEEADSRRKERSRRDHSRDRDRRIKPESEELVARHRERSRRDHSRDRRIKRESEEPDSRRKEHSRRDRSRDRRRERSGSRDRRHRD